MDKERAGRRKPGSSYSRFPIPYSLRAVRASGFTLLEMLAVILLIGIAAAAVAVSVTQGLASARVSAASGELAAALRAVRTQAIVHGNEHTFDVDTRDNTYRADNGPAVRLPSGMRIGITSAKEDQVNSHTGRIRFFPDGSSTGGHITLQRERRQWRVNVSWLTGAVSVAD
ncbi:type II secretion system protein H (GspH), partial [Dyella sp. AtDHG13]